MAIQWPTVAEASCQSLTVCGEIVADKKEIRQWCDRKLKDNWLAYRISVEHGPMYARIGLGGKSGKHCHVDVAVPAFFDGDEPKADLTEADAAERLNPLMGEKIEAAVRGVFTLPAANLPYIIKLTQSIVATEGDVSIRITGGTLSIKGTPIHRITWTLDEAEKDAKISMSAKTSLTISDSYLVEAFEVLKQGFATFIRRGKPHERH